jgi:hypothetical protein
MPKRLMIWTQALILALGACPLPAGLLALIFTSAAGCQLGESSPIPCVVLGHDFGHLLYEMATSMRFVVLTIPLAVLALIVWRIVLYFTSRHTEATDGRRQIKIKDSRDGLLKFPGPLTIGPPLKGRLLWLFGAACLTMLSVGHDTTAILATALFGVVTMMIVFNLLPGSRTLRLDASGFETARWFRTRRFRWSEVSNFAVWGSDSGGLVTFKDKTQRLGIFGKMNAALMSGRNNVLPNSFAAPHELARLMNTWRHSALSAIKRTGAEATAGQAQTGVSQKTSERPGTSIRAPLRQLRARRRLLLD